MLSDCHVHLLPLSGLEPGLFASLRSAKPLCLCSCHSAAELEALEAERSRGARFLISLGVHPQAPREPIMELIGQAAKEGRIRAIGEAGFDLLGEYAKDIKAQERAFDAQVELAADLGLPLVVHMRRALDLLLRRRAALRRLRALVFHSWPASAQEAEKLLGHGINAYFSLGTPLLFGPGRARDCAATLPLDRLLIESDAPWQPPRGREHSSFRELAEVYDEAARLRGIAGAELEAATMKTFLSLFGPAP
jgi:TatD DNase family protein